MEAPGRVELPTNGLGNRCSIHLSYGAKHETHYLTRISSSRDWGRLGKELGGSGRLRKSNASLPGFLTQDEPHEDRNLSWNYFRWRL